MTVSADAISQHSRAPALDAGVASHDSLDEARIVCERITRTRARNFYYGLRLLPEPKRSAMYAIYAWMRHADDAVDEARRPDERRARLDAFAADTRRVFTGDLDAALAAPESIWWLSFARTLSLFPIERSLFDDMIAGMRDDLDKFSYADDADLSRYCYRVASTVGLVCVRVWGVVNAADRSRADDLAVAKGQAFQRTNILRDLAQDFDDDPSRVYIPADAIARHGLTPADLRGWTRPGACARLVLEQAAIARRFYRESAELHTLIQPDSRPTLWAMTSIYSGILAVIERDPQRAAGSKRIRLSSLAKTSIALRALLKGAGPARGRRSPTPRAADAPPAQTQPAGTGS